VVVVSTTHFSANGTDTVVVVSTTHFLADGADTVVVVLAAEFVRIIHSDESNLASLLGLLSFTYQTPVCNNLVNKAGRMYIRC
jgi:hypothetical protein